MSIKFYFINDYIDEHGAVKFICNEHSYIKQAYLLETRDLERCRGTEKAYKHRLILILSAFYYYPALMKIYRKYDGKPISYAPAMSNEMMDKTVSLIGAFEPNSKPTISQVKRLLVKGYTKKDIAGQYDISLRTLYRILEPCGSGCV